MSYNETLERQYLRSIPQEGEVEWIGILAKRLLEVHSVNEVTANPVKGLEGDHFKKLSTQQCLQGIRWNNTQNRPQLLPDPLFNK